MRIEILQGERQKVCFGPTTPLIKRLLIQKLVAIFVVRRETTLVFAENAVAITGYCCVSAVTKPPGQCS